MPNPIHVLPISVHEMALGLAAIAGEIGGNGTVEINITASIPQIALSVTATGNSIATNNEVKRFAEEVAEISSLICQSAFLRSQGNNPPIFNVVYRSDATTQYFSVESVSDRAKALQLVTALSKHFKLMSRGAVLGASLPPQEQEAIQFKEQVVGDLAAQVSRLGVFLTQMGEKNSELTRSLTLDLEKQFQQKRTELEAQTKAEEERLKSDRAEFEKQRKEFDDRQRTHVRRDLLTKIQKNIDDRAKAAPITAGASHSRLLIHVVSWVFIVLSVAGGIFAGRALYESAGHMPFDWRVVPPFSAAVLLFAATLVFYFRWTARWADRLAFTDLAVQEYASDILRASWIAELLFEYNEEKEKEIPTEVLASLSEGLFKREEFRTIRYHPSDDLAVILKRMRSFKAGPQGVEITADGKK